MPNNFSTMTTNLDKDITDNPSDNITENKSDPDHTYVEDNQEKMNTSYNVKMEKDSMVENQESEESQKNDNEDEIKSGGKEERSNGDNISDTLKEDQLSSFKKMIVIHGLQKSDIQTWTQFCEECFAEKKPTPPSAEYFYRHYANDPHADPNLVRIAFESTFSVTPITRKISMKEEDRIMTSSVRIFHREISTGSFHHNDDIAEKDQKSQYIVVGGIGEVCTHPDYRKRGLATKLLQNAFEKMIQRNMKHSVLHASQPEIQQVYMKQGYENVTTLWSLIFLQMDKLFHHAEIDDGSDTGSIEGDIYQARLLSNLNEDSDSRIMDLMRIHRAYSENRFAGCVKRSFSYWRNYIGKELCGSSPSDTSSFWVLETKATPPQKPKLLAWISVRKRGEKFQLREFGADLSSREKNFSVKKAFYYLLYPAIQSARGVKMSNNNGGNIDSEGIFIGNKSNVIKNGVDVILHLPTVVLNDLVSDKEEDIANFWNLDSVFPDDDDGWMYKQLPCSDTEAKHHPSMVEIAKDIPHLIWPSDAF